MVPKFSFFQYNSNADVFAFKQSVQIEYHNELYFLPFFHVKNNCV
jgi:hypothetical protein